MIMNSSNHVFSEKLYLTDGGLETSLIYHQGIALNHFAAFELVNTGKGRKALEDYYRPYLELAERYQTGYILETPTWRANPDWGYKLGYSLDELTAINKNSVKLMRGFAESFGTSIPQLCISGNIGPRGDGYVAGDRMTIAEAENYHEHQIKSFALADVDVVSAITITYVNEAVGLVRAAAKFKLPIVISFTVETDGRLPDGETLKDAIEKTDEWTDGYVSHFMINCAHPNHFADKLDASEAWKERIKGIRANASNKSHEELDASDELDAGDKYALAIDYELLSRKLPNLMVYGGCCGTDHSHMEEICQRIHPGLKQPAEA